MADVRKALEEIETHVTFLDLGKILLNMLLVLLICLLVTEFFRISLYWTFLPSLVYLGFSLYKLHRKNKYLIVEQNVSELNEKLRTVADNIFKTNEIVESLKQDVLRSIPKIRFSELIDFKPIAFRIFAITVISIFVVFISAYNVEFNDFEFNVPISKGIRFGNEDLLLNNMSYEQGNLDDILGNKSVTKVGTQELNLVINPLDSSIDLNNFEETSKEDFNAPIFPKEIYTSYDVSYDEAIAKENQKVVKDYFDKISG